MRILAIGDIHGCSRAFDAVLSSIDPKPADLLITLGDCVDWGPDSAGVLARLIDLQTRTRLIALRGNHEEMLLRAWELPNEVDLWLKVGGRETVASYPDRRILDSHYEFLKDRCVDSFETDTHLFAHGGVDPELPFNQQSIPILRWKTFRSAQPHVSGKTLVCGHSEQRDGRPANKGHSICIDTGARHALGWLTCLDVVSCECVQANQKGEVRSFRLN